MTRSSSRILQADELSRVSSLWMQEAPVSVDIKAAPGFLETEPDPSPDSPPDKMDDPHFGAELERAQQRGYQAGFSEGKEVGLQLARTEVQPLIDRLTRSLAELSTLRPRLRQQAESDVLRLSMAIARRVLHRELTLDPESLEGIIRVALDKLGSRELCRVRVHPEQEETIRKAMTKFSVSPSLQLSPDPTLQPGDLLFETAHGILDASIEAQLREIERGFADKLSR